VTSATELRDVLFEFILRVPALVVVDHTSLAADCEVQLAVKAALSAS